MREPSSVGFEGNGVVSSLPQALLERLKDYGQEDAFALWYELSPEEREFFVKDIESLDLLRIDRIIRCSLRSQGLPVAAIEPVPESSVSAVEERSQEDRERWWKMGLKAISDGKLAVLLLSGGQQHMLRIFEYMLQWCIIDVMTTIIKISSSMISLFFYQHYFVIMPTLLGKLLR